MIKNNKPLNQRQKLPLFSHKAAEGINLHAFLSGASAGSVVAAQSASMHGAGEGGAMRSSAGTDVIITATPSSQPVCVCTSLCVFSSAGEEITSPAKQVRRKSRSSLGQPLGRQHCPLQAGCGILLSLVVKYVVLCCRVFVFFASMLSSRTHTCAALWH